MSAHPFRLPPPFSYPARAVPAAEFEAAVYSDAALLRRTAYHRRSLGLSVANLKMTVGQWRFRSRYHHQIHDNPELQLAVKAALEEVIWRARLCDPFDPARPSFLGYATVPGCQSFPMRTYIVMELRPDNFALIPRCDGPLLSHNQREQYGDDVAYAVGFSPATKRWMEDFGAYITRGWDQVITPDFNIVPVDSDTDESSLPLPVPLQLVEAVLSDSQDSVGSAASVDAVLGSPPGSPLSLLPAAAQVAFQQALEIVQQPLSPVGDPLEPEEEPMEDSQVVFIEE